MLLSSISLALTRLGQRLGRWTPLALWPNGASSPGLWISPRTLTSEWQGYTGTTPVATPGTVADSSNPVGLALDIRAGNPVPLGPELVVNGDFATDTAWTKGADWAISGGFANLTPGSLYGIISQNYTYSTGATYKVVIVVGAASGADVMFLTLGGRQKGPHITAAGTYSFYFVASAGDAFIGVQDQSNVGTISIDNISVKEIPGLHMLQATAADRPLLSARVNLLTYTEDFSNAAWSKAAVTVNSDVSVAPDGTTTADSLIEDSTLAGHYVSSMQIAVTSGIVVTISVRAKNASGTRWFQISMGSAVMGGAVGKFDLVNGAAVSVPGTSSGVAAITDIGNGWYLCQFTFIPTSSGNTNVFLGMGDSSGSSFLSPYQGDGSSGFYIWGAQYEQGPTATAYQRVNTASDYDASAGPTYLKFDGVDDSLASAAFAAGTLIDGMDCMIAVRRDSAADLALMSDAANEVFGVCVAGAAYQNVSGAGTPTVWVDGVQLAGGVYVTAGTLDAALTVGDWHIVEFRGLDLSLWESIGFSNYTGLRLNGPRGDILLYPSTASTEDKDAARQYLADYYGVTLP